MGLNSRKTFSRNYAFTALNSTDSYLSKKPLYLQLDSLESHETAAICSDRGSGCRTKTLRWALHSTEKQTQQQPEMKRRHSVLSHYFATQRSKRNEKQGHYLWKRHATSFIPKWIKLHKYYQHLHYHEILPIVVLSSNLEFTLHIAQGAHMLDRIPSCLKYENYYISIRHFVGGQSRIKLELF